MTTQWHPEGGRGGLPSDMLTSFKVGRRRLKTSASNELAELVEDGLAYSFSGSFPSVSAGDSISVNLSFASDAIIRRVTVNHEFKIEIYSDHSIGVADGIFPAQNLNVCSDDVSPASSQIYSQITTQGNRLELGYTEMDPFVIDCEGNGSAVVIQNTSAEIQDIEFVILFEELSARNPSFGLTPSTELFPDTEMSQYG